MKQAVTGYITALINSHERRINNLNNIKVPDNVIKNYEEFKNELCDLLDFVEDIPQEVKDPGTVIINANDAEIENLKKYIRELEDSCENMCTVERNLREKIRKLEGENE